MSDSYETCNFVLDPDRPETWDREEEKERCHVPKSLLDESGHWTCPHKKEGKDFCIFHQPIQEKDDDKVTEEFFKSIEKENTSNGREVKEQKTQFIGAIFGDIDLNSSSTPIDADETINLMHATVFGRINWSNIKINAERLNLAGTKFEKKVSFEQTVFDTSVDFRDTEFCGETDFSNTNFRDTTYFNRVEFHKIADFQYATLNGFSPFSNADFYGDANLSNATFRGQVNFNAVDFYAQTSFNSATFSEETGFLESQFHNDITFKRVCFNGTTDFGGAKFDHHTSFHWSRFNGDTIFNGAEFGNDIHFTMVEFKGKIDFIKTNLDGVSFRAADLTGANFTGSSLCNVNFESALLSRATLFGADLRGTKLSGTVFGDVRIDEETLLLGHPEDDSTTNPHTFAAIRSKKCCIYDPAYGFDNDIADIDQAKSVYRALEELGQKSARPRLQARCFIRRQDLQKKDYWNNAADSTSSLETRIIAGARWSRARTAELVLHYGESPWRIIAYSLCLIIAFGLLYPLGGWIETTGSSENQSLVTYAQIAEEPILLWDSIYHSAMLFATGSQYGGIKAVNFTGEVLTTIQALSGPTLLALLVFVLGRRAAR